MYESSKLIILFLYTRLLLGRSGTETHNLDHRTRNDWHYFFQKVTIKKITKN